ENTTPAVFGSLPFPDDLYFDQGRPADGDGTLLDAGATIGLADRVVTVNAASIEDALDLLDGFGTTTAVYFFLSGPLDPGSLPASPVLEPALTDGVFCADAASATPVPVLLEFGIDSRIPNVLAVLPLPGKPRRPLRGGGARARRDGRDRILREPALPDARPEWRRAVRRPAGGPRVRELRRQRLLRDDRRALHARPERHAGGDRRPADPLHRRGPERHAAGGGLAGHHPAARARRRPGQRGRLRGGGRRPRLRLDRHRRRAARLPLLELRRRRGVPAGHQERVRRHGRP